MIDWRKGLEEAYGLLIEAQADPDLAAPEWVERCDQWMDTYPPSKARAPDAVPCPKCADRMNLALRLRAIAADIAAAGINGFGNQVSDVADALERTDQPAVVMFDDRRDDPYLYPTEQTMSYQDAINAHFQQCLARGKEPDYPTWLLQAALDFLDCRDDSPNPIEAIREYLRTPDQQQDGCTSNDAGLVQPKSGTDIPTDKS
jgi:hypothetical protein